MRIIETDPETGLDTIVEVPDENIGTSQGQYLNLAVGLRRWAIETDEWVRVPERSVDNYGLIPSSIKRYQ